MQAAHSDLEVFALEITRLQDCCALERAKREELDRMLQVCEFAIMLY